RHPPHPRHRLHPGQRLRRRAGEGAAARGGGGGGVGLCRRGHSPGPRSGRRARAAGSRLAGQEREMSMLEIRLAGIVRADPGLMHVLTTVRGLGLNGWRIFSGAVYQSVWNAVTGRPVGYGRKDYDLGYFDPDVSWQAEDAVIKRVAAAFQPPFRDMVEARNQARVHRWFEGKFGEP